MKKLSLAGRLALLCMLVCTAILLAESLHVQIFARSYFQRLDRENLIQRLDGIKQVLRAVHSPDTLGEALIRVSTLLDADGSSRAWISAQDGHLLLTTDALVRPPPDLARRPAQEMWRWQDGGRRYHGMRDSLLMSDGQRIDILLVIYSREHQGFLSSLLLWQGAGLLVMVLLGGGLGLLLARRTLRPLHELADQAAGISPANLRQSLALDRTPRELEPLVTALNAMLTRLNDAFDRLQYFSSDLAHELRTPVTTLMTRTEVTLSRERSAEGYQEALLGNLEALRSMSRLIDDMLFLARADNGRLVARRERIWLQDLMTDLLDYYELLAEDAGLRIQVSGNAWVDGDPAMLRRALANLLSNALRYSPAGSVIGIAIEQDSREVRIRVSNPGKEIAPEHLARLFERFYRADASRREGQANVGLGLSITQAIIESHGGRIDCQSSAGITTFSIHLPPAAGQPRGISEPADG